MQFFNEFFLVLKTFRNQRNHSYLMALHRKSTKLKGLDSTPQQYHEYATPYAFRYIKHHWEFSRTLDNVTSAHNITIYGCECTPMKSMGLPCKDFFKNVYRMGKNFLPSSLLKTVGHTVIIAHSALQDFPKSLHQPRMISKQAGKRSRKGKLQKYPLLSSKA